jgi:hypothetical protein
MRCFGEIFGQKKRETQIGLVGSDLPREGKGWPIGEENNSIVVCCVGVFVQCLVSNPTFDNFLYFF